MVGGHNSSSEFTFNPCVFGVNSLGETDRVTLRGSCSHPDLIPVPGGSAAAPCGSSSTGLWGQERSLQRSSG